jgi:hypothetical protein
VWFWCSSGPFLDAPGADLGVLVLLAAQYVGAAVPVDLAGEQLAEGLDADWLASPVGAEQPFPAVVGRPAASVAMLADRRRWLLVSQLSPWILRHWAKNAVHADY